MKIVIGLGNPGKSYEKTRHNVGFLAVNYLQKKWNFPPFSLNKKCTAEIAPSNSKFKIQNSKFFLVKPQTFMNKSGESIKLLMTFYKLSPADIIVIHDDLDLPLGTYKIATDSRSAGHNGVQNVIDNLGSQEFHRVRIGIQPKEPPSSTPRNNTWAHKFVLEKMSKQEQTVVENLFPSIALYIDTFLNK